MGQTNSTKTTNYNSQAERILHEMRFKARELSEKYTYEFLDDNFCNRIALIYNDRLSKFRKQEINNIQYSLGIVNDNPIHKRKICELIINHYIRRIRLMSTIIDNMEQGWNMINALTVGPRCYKHPEVFDQETCLKQDDSEWQTSVFLPNPDLNENRLWYQYVHYLQIDYIAYIKKLNAILRQMDDFDDDVTDERLKLMEFQLNRLILRYQERFRLRYRMILTTPTMTAAQKIEKEHREEAQKREYAAEASAVRIAEGLPPEGYE